MAPNLRQLSSATSRREDATAAMRHEMARRKVARPTPKAIGWRIARWEAHSLIEHVVRPSSGSQVEAKWIPKRIQEGRPDWGGVAPTRSSSKKETEMRDNTGDSAKGPVWAPKGRPKGGGASHSPVR